MITAFFIIPFQEAGGQRAERQWRLGATSVRVKMSYQKKPEGREPKGNGDPQFPRAFDV